MCAHYCYFLQKLNVWRIIDLSSIYKCISAMRMLTYGLVLTHLMNTTRSEKAQPLNA